MTHYNKPATTIAQQIAKLETRGMVCADHALVEHWLRTVGYYRLSAYWHYFEEKAPHGATRSKQFKDNTSFENVKDLYIFDRELRLRVTEAIERIEIAMRTVWVYELSQKAGAHAHIEARNFQSRNKHLSALGRLSSELSVSKNPAVEYYKREYTDPAIPSLWVVSEIMTFGQLIGWIKITKYQNISYQLCELFGLTANHLFGALDHLHALRNICAHHSRLWNIILTTKMPKIMTLKNQLVEYADYEEQQHLDKRVYNSLVLLIYLLRNQNIDTSYPARLKTLIKTMPKQYRNAMGFPHDWVTRPIWYDTISHSEWDKMKQRQQR